MMRRPLAALLLGLVLTATMAGCTKTATTPGEARARLQRGDRLEAAPPARPFAPVADGDVLLRGTRIRALAGEPRLELPGGATVALKQGASVVASLPLFVDSGEVLMTAARATSVSTAIADVRAAGIVRIGQSLASSVRVYAGTATVSSSGRSLVVDARRQTAVPGEGLLAKTATPTSWRRDDAWDARYLRTVIAVTDALEAQGRGFGLHASSASAAELASLVPGMTEDGLARARARRPSGDTLVGGAIAAAGATSPESVFELRDSGAAWGIVAVERAAGDEYRAIALVRAAIAAWLQRHAVGSPRGPAAIARPVTGVPSTSVSQPPAATAVTPSTTPGSSPPTPTTTAPPPIVTLPPVTTPIPGVTVPPTVTTIVDTAEDTVDGVVGGLIGG